jgi:hypothetical protein
MSSQGNAETVAIQVSQIESGDHVSHAQSQPIDEDDDAEVWQEVDMLVNPMTEENRHAGDMKIYAYYAKMAGWWTTGLYLFACCTFVFGVTFPCKKPPCRMYESSKRVD